MPAPRLAHRAIIVAGASSGIGRATALACAREGVDLAIIARRREPLEDLAHEIRGLGRRVEVVVADLTERAAAEKAIAITTDRLGPLDVIVHAAGTNLKERALDVLTDAGWEEILRTNLTAALYVTQAAVPRLRGRGGRLIYVASLAVQRPDTSGVADQASKHGLVGLAHGTMEEEKAHGIRTTVISPGLTDTPLVLKRPTPTPPETLARALRPEDVADACVFVAALPLRVHVPDLPLAPAELF